jgi:hypothetical protein
LQTDPAAARGPPSNNCLFMLFVGGAAAPLRPLEWLTA